eukprot:6398090-Karenia_brevis.AAC.1
MATTSAESIETGDMCLDPVNFFLSNFPVVDPAFSLRQLPTGMTKTARGGPVGKSTWSSHGP